MSSKAPPSQRMRAASRTGAPPSGAHFARFGIPFLLFMAVGTWGYSKMLAPAYERAGSGLYGKQEIDPNPAKRKEKKPSSSSSADPTSPTQDDKKLPSLEEEFAKMQKDFDKDYTNKRVPRPPGVDERRSH